MAEANTGTSSPIESDVSPAPEAAADLLDAASAAAADVSAAAAEAAEDASASVTEAAAEMKETATGSQGSSADAVAEKMEAVKGAVKDAAPAAPAMPKLAKSESKGVTGVKQVDEAVEKVAKMMEPTKGPAGETRLQELVMYRNPPVSIVVFATLLISMCVIYFTKMSFVRLFSILALVFLIPAYAVVFGSVKLVAYTKREPFPAPGDKPRAVFRVDPVKALVEPVIDGANQGLHELYKCLYGQNNILFAKIVGVLLAGAIIGKVIDATVLMFLIVLGAFTLPKVYEMNKKQIDEAVDKGMKQVDAKTKELQKIADEKTKEYTKLATEKAKEVQKLAGEKVKEVQKVVEEKTGMKKGAATPAPTPMKVAK